jgi:hypothetical protein
MDSDPCHPLDRETPFLLGGASAFQFAQALETLVRRTQGPSRKLLMLELPLFPFNHGTAWPNAVSPASMMSS